MIKDISDVVSSKGWKYTGGVALIAIGMAGLYHLIKKGANIGECYANTKISTASKTTLLDKKGRIDRDRDAERHRQRMEVESLKARSKKEILELRLQYKKGVSVQSTYEEIDFLPSDSVPSYDELIAGEVVDSRSLRLGVRSFHIGEDCGLMARTNIGKTSWVFQFSMCIALGYQNGPILSPEWELHQPMRVLYFAFEQNRKHIKKKYAHTIKSIPNLHVDVETSASDFQTMRRRIEKMQNEIGDRRLLVVFDNITKLKGSASDEKKAFFQWLEDYRRKCDINGKPITYLKVYHTQGAYKDYMAIEPTSNYGPKSDIYFTQDLVALGMCKEGNGSMRYLKELKNKYEDEKQSVSIFRYAGTEAPFYDYVGEATECDVLPSKDGRRGQVKSVAKESELAESSSGKRGRKEVYSLELLAEMYTERQSGLTWEKILANHGIDYDHNSKDGLKNKHKGIREAFRRHGLK